MEISAFAKELAGVASSARKTVQAIVKSYEFYYIDTAYECVSVDVKKPYSEDEIRQIALERLKDEYCNKKNIVFLENVAEEIRGILEGKIPRR